MMDSTTAVTVLAITPTTPGTLVNGAGAGAEPPEPPLLVPGGRGGINNTWNTAGLDVPPPAEGFVTVTLKLPGVLRSPVAITALSCVLDTYVVALLAPPNLTIELTTNPLPLITILNPGLPTRVDAGEILVIVGNGFFVLVTL